MRVYLKEPGSEKFVPVAGPADLVGKSGTVRLTGEPSDRAFSRWAASLGLFAMAGGSVTHKEAK